MATPTGRQQIKVIMTELRNLTSKIVASLALDCTANFIESTPVDTGWARANWFPQIGSALETALGSREDAESGSLPGEQQTGIARIATSYTIAQGAIFISNNVPYIQALNDGHSDQAPAGFVEAGIDEAINQNFRFGNLKSPFVGGS